MTAPRWSDDPWSALTTGEGEAYRRGWEAARRQASRVALRVPIPEDCSAAEAHGRLMGGLDASSAIAAMEPPHDVLLRRPLPAAAGAGVQRGVRGG